MKAAATAVAVLAGLMASIPVQADVPLQCEEIVDALLPQLGALETTTANVASAQPAIASLIQSDGPISKSDMMPVLKALLEYGQAASETIVTYALLGHCINGTCNSLQECEARSSMVME